MANYRNPIDLPNPFFTTPPIVLAARHVRVTLAGEVVAEDPNALPRYVMRVDAQRVYPQQQVTAPPQRNLPECGARKKPFV